MGQRKSARTSVRSTTVQGYSEQELFRKNPLASGGVLEIREPTERPGDGGCTAVAAVAVQLHRFISFTFPDP